jgi:hypothetical protein
MKSREIIFSFVFCFLILAPLTGRSQVGNVDGAAKIKPTVLVLGTYRMNGRGSARFDDVSTPERQKELEALVEKLKKFKPTKIAVEIDSSSEAETQRLYERFVAGNYRLSRNETNQIGFRLAKELGHEKIYCVDWREFPSDPAYNFEGLAARDSELDSFLKVVYGNLRREVDAEREKLLNLSILDQHILLNQPQRMKREQQMYFDLMRIGRGSEYAGANYLSWWYGRNMKILVNIIRITDSPQDRILVIYGFGHAQILTQLARESGFYNVESPLKYLQGRKRKNGPRTAPALSGE